ncbi:MAG: cation diffusion facilitator family transporter [Fimbriimonas sp.]
MSDEMQVHAETDLLKRRAAGISLAYNSVLAVVKLAGAVLTGSLGLFSEAAHSGVDVFASLIALVSIRAAAQPPDDEHPYGHGKIEAMAALAESTLLVLISLYVAAEGVQRFIGGSELKQVQIGIYIMAASCITSLITSRHVDGIAKRTNSMALRSNAQHLMVDFWTSLGVLAALGITMATGWRQADSVFAILLAVWLGGNAYKLGREAFEELIDRRIEAEEILAIEETIRSTDGVLGFHKLRTRHSGHWHYVDVHIVVPRDWSVVQGHDVADAVEKRLQATLAPCVAVVHVDPFDEHQKLTP